MKTKPFWLYLLLLMPALTQGQKAAQPVDSADLYCRWGKSLSDSGHYQMAVLKFKKAVILRHNFPEAWTEWGIALSNVGRYDEELAKYQEAVKIDSSYGDAYFNWGTTLSATGRPAEAAQVFKTGMAKAPKFAKNYEGLGQIEAQNGNYQSALADFQKSLAINVENPWCHFWAAGCWANLKKKPEALAALKQAMQYGGDFYKMEAEKDPAFYWLKPDPDFKKLVRP